MALLLYFFIESFDISKKLSIFAHDTTKNRIAGLLFNHYQTQQ